MISSLPVSLLQPPHLREIFDTTIRSMPVPCLLFRDPSCSLSSRCGHLICHVEEMSTLLYTRPRIYSKHQKCLALLSPSPEVRHWQCTPRGRLRI